MEKKNLPQRTDFTQYDDADDAEDDEVYSNTLSDTIHN